MAYMKRTTGNRGAEVSFFVIKPQAQPSKADSLQSQPTPAPEEQQSSGRRRGGAGLGQGTPGAGKKGDSARVRIYNDKNELIRSLRWSVDKRVQSSQYWGMEEKGFRQPGSPKPQPDAPEPGGIPGITRHL